MPKLHPGVTDKEYWDLRLKLFELQRLVYDLPADLGLEEVKRDLLEDLHNYLITEVEEEDPWS